MVKSSATSKEEEGWNRDKNMRKQKCTKLEYGTGTMRKCIRSKLEKHTVILKDLNGQDEVCELKTAKRLELGSVRVMVWPFCTQLYPGLS